MKCFEGIETAHTDEQHFYRVAGLTLPSVTTVLDVINQPYLAEWRERVGEEEAERVLFEAGEIGTLVHSAFERVCHREPIERILDDLPDQRAVMMTRSFQYWFARRVRKVVAVEQRCYSLRDGGYAGTFDLLAYLDADPLPTLIDFKTSNGMHEKFWEMQIAPYRVALIDHNIATLRGLILLVNKQTGRIIEVPVIDPRAGYQSFRAALTLWRYLYA